VKLLLFVKNYNNVILRFFRAEVRRYFLGYVSQNCRSARRQTAFWRLFAAPWRNSYEPRPASRRSPFFQAEVTGPPLERINLKATCSAPRFAPHAE